VNETGSNRTPKRYQQCRGGGGGGGPFSQSEPARTPGGVALPSLQPIVRNVGSQAAVAVCGADAVGPTNLGPEREGRKEKDRLGVKVGGGAVTQLLL